jgi:hypothetical protein
MSLQAAALAAGKLQNWDKKASVRVKPRRILMREEEERGKLYFSPELVPIGRHPLVTQFGPAAVREMQVCHLYRYLDFTTLLELDVIGAVSREIALGRIDFEMPDVVRAEAFKLCTDEAHHAYFSDDVKRQVAAATDVEPEPLATPAFLKTLRSIQRGLPPGASALGEMLFTVVSETLISSILCEIPKDKRVVSAVREIVADHAEDEGRHSAYFSQFFGLLWPQLSDAQQAVVGPLLPHFILAFLRPDEDAIRGSLRRLPLEHDQIDTVIAESYPREAVLEKAREAAAGTLRLLEHRGVLDDPRIGDEFRACGLLR